MCGALQHAVIKVAEACLWCIHSGNCGNPRAASQGFSESQSFQYAAPLSCGVCCRGGVWRDSGKHLTKYYVVLHADLWGCSGSCVCILQCARLSCTVFPQNLQMSEPKVTVSMWVGCDICAFLAGVFKGWADLCIWVWYICLNNPSWNWGNNHNWIFLFYQIVLTKKEWLYTVCGHNRNLVKKEWQQIKGVCPMPTSNVQWQVSVYFSAEVMKLLLLPNLPIRGPDLCLSTVETWEQKDLL